MKTSDFIFLEKIFKDEIEWMELHLLFLFKLQQPTFKVKRIVRNMNTIRIWIFLILFL